VLIASWGACTICRSGEKCDDFPWNSIFWSEETIADSIGPDLSYFTRSYPFHGKSSHFSPDLQIVQAPQLAMSTKEFCGCASKAWPRPAPPEERLIDSTFVLPTLLANHPVTVHITKVSHKIIPPNLSVSIRVNNVTVALSDVPARNGVYHFIPFLIKPPVGHRPPRNGMDGYNPMDWEDWRDWLPQWAEEN